MLKKKVAVLRGGPSGEYDVSLKTGGTVLRNLSEKYQPIDILISKSGQWHRSGAPVTLYDAIKDVDVIFNALHGAYGEDGKLQSDLDIVGIPYTGSKSVPSAIGMNKILSKERFDAENIQTGLYHVINREDNYEHEMTKIFRTMSYPVVIKPASSGSSLGVSIAGNFEDALDALPLAFVHSPQVLVEEYVKGREATCGVIENFRGRDIYALMPIEIVPQGSRFFDYGAKYSGATLEICPSHFPHAVKKEIERLAIAAHKALGLSHYSRTDFMVSPTKGVYVLETNTLPGLTEQSLLPQSLRAVGSSLPEFLDHVLTLAMSGR